jgi:hypothetical protein
MQPWRKEYFLWPTESGVRLLTPHRIIDLPQLQPPVPPAPVPHQADASSWWPEFPWDEFDFSGEPCQLWLDSNLPEAWQSYPFERFWEAGRPLEVALEVIRLARDYVTRLDNPADQKILVLDRWPDTTFCDAFEPLVRAERMEIWRGDLVDRRLAGRPDLSHYGLLILLAHGGDGDILLTDELGAPWRPRLPDGLPRTVWLATCSDHLAELFVFARQVLNHGAKQFLAAEGRLSATQWAASIRTRLDLGHTSATTLKRTYGSRSCKGDAIDRELRRQILDWARHGTTPRIDAAGNAAEGLRHLAELVERLPTLSLVGRPLIAGQIRYGLAAVQEKMSLLQNPDSRNVDRAEVGSSTR